ncbi:triose-phosphate isomerase [Streptomyces bluensis]|uniref:triose-phosphate isomerase n=1 Tax=Streptomyces bluensis TaxID=33897 RepID=UPI00167250B1|nr:triose-phosphate isomerase family protein [Streptomyces bluensis]GGZ46455.1 triosephosphate isomerase [Streptomyces bluensis]
MSGPAAPPVLLGVSLKMYFGHHQTLNWARKVADLARDHPAVTSGAVRLFVLPAFPALVPANGILGPYGISVGAQDIATEDTGPYTGEVGGPSLREIGCQYAEVGHAERRRLYGEDDTVVAAKTAAALRNGLTPVLCVGERDRGTPQEAAERTVAEAARLLHGLDGSVVVAYEPQWAIGAPEPASTEHIGTVCTALREWLDSRPRHTASTVIYGGSAGPGLLSRLAGTAEGLFLGRFAHDPANVAAILDEIRPPVPAEVA